MNSLSHNLVVVYRVPYVNIWLERGCSHGRIEIQDIGRFVVRAEVRVDSVDKGRFARTSHADGDDHHRLFLVLLLFRRHRCSRQHAVYYLVCPITPTF
jgi:hypothetical protein